MLLQLTIALLLGILAGTITGLIPGIHINLIGVLLISLTTKIFIHPLYATAFIVAMATTHTFTDFIPSVFLGCPDTDTELSILPAHKLLKQGRGFEAVSLSAKGGIIATLLTVTTLPLTLSITNLYTYIESIIPFLLLVISIILILKEKKPHKAFIIFTLTGILGILLTEIQINQPLLPLLSGLFGASTILTSIQNNTIIPEQKITKQKIRMKRPLITSIIGAPLCALLPAIGSSQAATIGSLFIKNSKKQFIIMTGIINTLVMNLSFIFLFSIQKTRTGASAALKEILKNISKNELILIIAIIIITSTTAYTITLKISKQAAKHIHKIQYKKISTITLSILVLIVLIISGPIGVLVLTASTILGIYTIESKVKRVNMMGCLILPTIILYIT